MSADQQPPGPHRAEAVSGAIRYRVQEICRICGIDRGLVVALVTSGVVAPPAATAGDWIFSEVELLRLKRAWRLHRDLGVELDTLGLVLELLDEVERLRRQVGRGGD